MISIKKATYGTKCFYITREDGTETDISFMSCLDSKKNKKIKDISAACRESIDYIIKGLRENLTFPLVCPLSGVVIKNIKDVHIDHYDLDFKDVVSLWIDKNGGVDNLHKYVCETKDNETTTYFTDEDIKERLLGMFNLILRDNVKAREMKSDGNYARVKSSDIQLNSQEYFFSLSYQQAEEAQK